MPSKSISKNLSIFLLCFSTNLSIAQNKVEDTLVLFKSSWFVSADYETTLNPSLSFSSVGFSASFLFKQKGFIGIYATGSISEISYVSLNKDILLFNDKNVNFAHGGIYMGIKSLNSLKNNTFFSLKIGRGAFFLYKDDNTYNYSLARDDVWVITPSIESQIKMLSWINLKFSIGVRFVEVISSYSFSTEGKKIKLYQSSNFEGFIIGFSLKFCKN